MAKNAIETSPAKPMEAVPPPPKLVRLVTLDPMPISAEGLAVIERLLSDESAPKHRGHRLPERDASFLD